MTDPNPIQTEWLKEQQAKAYSNMSQGQLIHRCMDLSRRGHELPEGIRTIILRHENGVTITDPQRKLMVGFLVKGEAV